MFSCALYIRLSQLSLPLGGCPTHRTRKKLSSFPSPLRVEREDRLMFYFLFIEAPLVEYSREGEKITTGFWRGEKGHFSSLFFTTKRYKALREASESRSYIEYNARGRIQALQPNLTRAAHFL